MKSIAPATGVGLTDEKNWIIRFISGSLLLRRLMFLCGLLADASSFKIHWRTDRHLTSLDRLCRYM